MNGKWSFIVHTDYLFKGECFGSICFFIIINPPPFFLLKTMAMSKCKNICLTHTAFLLGCGVGLGSYPSGYPLPVQSSSYLQSSECPPDSLATPSFFLPSAPTTAPLRHPKVGPAKPEWPVWPALRAAAHAVPRLGTLLPASRCQAPLTLPGRQPTPTPHTARWPTVITDAWGLMMTLSARV